MAHRGNKGQPVQIVRREGEGRFSLYSGALQQLLLADDVKNLPVVVVSIAGKFRQGKSFLLNFFLRYMRNRTQKDWMGDPNAPLEGFSWRGGGKRETTGILMWNEVFVVTTNEGRKVAVIFLDTQGTFDCESSSQEGTNIFALSMMASSVQIYNLSQNISEDDLQYLLLFAEYGRLALKETTKKPFQKLVFLVRDWQPYERNYGFAGGNGLVKERLRITEGQPEELKKLRSGISSSFTEICGFLMPRPEHKVTSVKTFDGCLSDINNDFKEQLRELVSSVLTPCNLKVKKINGCEISCKELLYHLEMYAKMFKNGGLPEHTSVFEAVVEANNSTAVDRALDNYRNNMEKVFNGERPYLDPESLKEEHQRVQKSALEQFDELSKLGREARSAQHKDRLEKMISQQFESFLKRNEGERIKAEEQKIMDAARRNAQSIVDEAQDRERRILIASTVGCFAGGTSLAARTAGRFVARSLRPLAARIETGADIVAQGCATYISCETIGGALTQGSTSDGDKSTSDGDKKKD